MNKWIGIGRLTADPTISVGNNNMTIARFTLAVDRRKKDGESTADFIQCKAFDKRAEFAEKYLRKGIKVCVTGSINTGSYTNREGRKVYTTDILVEEVEFVEAKNSTHSAETAPYGQNSKPQQEAWLDVSDDVLANDGLPF